MHDPEFFNQEFEHCIIHDNIFGQTIIKRSFEKELINKGI